MKKESATDSVEAQGQNELLPCPFCGDLPQVGPIRPEIEGDCVGYVRCDNPLCPARPAVSHNIRVNDSRGVAAYQANAVARWNQRAGIDSVASSLTQTKGEAEELLASWRDQIIRLEEGGFLQDTPGVRSFLKDVKNWSPSEEEESKNLGEPGAV